MQEYDDIAFLRMAYECAYDFSTDPSTQNGAVLVDASGEPLVEGANHFPTGVEEKEVRWERPLKYSYVEHAERNVIFAAARQGLKTQDLIMYCPWAACSDCARAIIQAGIKEVVCHHDPYADERFGMPVAAHWKESIAIALGMLKEAGVGLRWIDEKLYKDNEKQLQIRFNGQLVSP
jgi:dCMP deaminase